MSHDTQTQIWQKIPVQSPPTPNQQPISSHQNNLISLLQLCQFLPLCWATVTACALLTLHNCSVKHLGKDAFFTRMQLIGSCFSNRKSFIMWDQVPIPNQQNQSISSDLYSGPGPPAALQHRCCGTSSAHTVCHQVYGAQAAEVFPQKLGKGHFKGHTEQKWLIILHLV